MFLVCFGFVGHGSIPQLCEHLDLKPCRGFEQTGFKVLCKLGEKESPVRIRAKDFRELRGQPPICA
jgi:hypothetical protein